MKGATLRRATIYPPPAQVTRLPHHDAHFAEARFFQSSLDIFGQTGGDGIDRSHSQNDVGVLVLALDVICQFLGCRGALGHLPLQSQDAEQRTECQ